MPISKEFNQFFNEFVAKYKAKPANYFWPKGQKEDLISPILDDLLAIITKDGDSFHDTSIIDHLNPTVLLSGKDNSHLLECWMEFLKKYNAATQLYSPNNANQSIQIKPEGKASESYIAELEASLSLKEANLFSTHKSYEADTILLRKQVTELKKQLKCLETENKQLRAEVTNQKLFESLHPQIEVAQRQVAVFNDLLSKLKEVTAKKPLLTDSVSTSVVLQQVEKKEGANTQPPVIVAKETNSAPTPKTKTPTPAPLESVISETITIVNTPPAPPKAPVAATPKDPNFKFFKDTLQNQLDEAISKRKLVVTNSGDLPTQKKNQHPSP